MQKISLKAARVNAGLTQVQAAEKLGINEKTLSNYENFKHKMDIETAKKISDLYKQDINNINFF